MQGGQHEVCDCAGRGDAVRGGVGAHGFEQRVRASEIDTFGLGVCGSGWHIGEIALPGA